MSRTDGWDPARRLAALAVRPPARPVRDARRDPDTVPLPIPAPVEPPDDGADPGPPGWRDRPVPEPVGGPGPRRGPGVRAGPQARPWPGLASWSEVGAGVPAPREATRGAGGRRDARRHGGLLPHTPRPGEVPEPDAPGQWDGDVGDDGDGDGPSGEGGRAPVPRPAGNGRIRRRLQRWVPASLAGSLLDPGRPGAVALVLVVLAAAVLAGFGVWSSRPQAQPIGGLPAVAVGGGPPTPAAAPAPAPAAQPGPLVVSVVGKVARPGLVRVPDGARVADAVDAAGGALPGVDLSVLNLARRLGDGEQVAIGVKPAADAQAAGAPAGGGAAAGSSGAAASAGGAAAGGTAPGGAAGGGATGSGATGSGATGAKVNLNQATAEQLDALPGVGPVTAKKILDWRAQNGRFSRVEQLREVDGIGERKFAQLRDAVTV